MKTGRIRSVGAVAALSAMLFIGCAVDDDADAERTAAADTQAVTPMPQPQPGQTQPGQSQPATSDLRLEVDISERQVKVFRGGQQVETHPVAVGSDKWPTPTGEWTIGQVVWNPRWVPPKDEEWAKDEEIAEPGAPDNPLGHAQLVYSPPNSIHGTSETESLGKAVSHGSIRVSNPVAEKLARMVMEAGGAGKDESWYQQAKSNRKERRDVNIPNPVPIKVVQ